MQKMLFDVANFSKATFKAQVDSKLLGLKAGEQVNTSINGELTISGKTVPTSFDVQLTGLGNGAISASTNKPTVLSTTSFGLDDGVTALQEIAMLNSISKTVPLTFSVVFK
jgi:polyisoprenoid-binding protein YceI